MKKALIAFGMLLMAAPAYADITTRLSSSVQLTVDSPSVTTNRIASAYSVSGNNISPSAKGGLCSLTSVSAVSYTPTTYSLATDGDAFLSPKHLLKVIA